MLIKEDSETIERLKSQLIDLRQPIALRTHCAFLLRTLASNLSNKCESKSLFDESTSALAEALKNKEDSSLMRHELAYILGQVNKSCYLMINNFYNFSVHF